MGKDDKATLASLCSSQPGAASLTPHGLQDRLRLFLLLHLHKASGVDKELLEKLEALLRDNKVDLRSFGWLQQFQAFQTSVAQAHKPAESSGGARGVFSTVMKAADQIGVGDNARFLKDKLAAGVKQLLPSRRDTAVTRAVSALMDNRGGAEEESFAYLDPKLPPGDPGSSRSRSHYTQAIVFMCGPGNYLEYLSIREQVAVQQAGAAGAGSTRNVLYGCAEMQTPSEFLAQVAQLGEK